MEILEMFTTFLVADFLRYFIAATVAYLLIWVILKNKLKHRIIQKRLPKVKRMLYEFRYSISTVFIFALVGIFIAKSESMGWTAMYMDISEYGWLYYFVSIILMILLHDVYFYWTHRWMHHPKIFKHVHLVHHKSHNPSPWAAYSFHPLEAIVQAGIGVLIVFLIPNHPSAFLIFLTYQITRNVVGHLGYEILPSWFIKIPILNWHTTTVHHDLHHKYSKGNYGLYFVWWDRLMKTEDHRYLEKFEEVTMRKAG